MTTFTAQGTLLLYIQYIKYITYIQYIAYIYTYIHTIPYEHKYIKYIQYIAYINIYIHIYMHYSHKYIHTIHYIHNTYITCIHTYKRALMYAYIHTYIPYIHTCIPYIHTYVRTETNKAYMVLRFSIFAPLSTHTVDQ